MQPGKHWKRQSRLVRSGQKPGGFIPVWMKTCFSMSVWRIKNIIFLAGMIADVI